MGYECKQCGALFAKSSLLQEHKRIRGHGDKFICTTCGKSFGRRDNYDRHLLRHADPSLYQCGDCGMLFSRGDNLQRHREQKHIQCGAGVKRSADNDNIGPIPTKKQAKSTDDLYHLRVMKETDIPKFQTTATHYKVDFQDLEVRGIAEILKTLKKIFELLIKELTEFMDKNDLIRLSVECPELDFPITLPFMKVTALTAERLLSEIERVLQSYEQFVLDQTLEMELVHVQLPKGGVGKRCHFVDFNKMLKTKRCFIRIQNNDDICCARALVTAKARIDGDEQWNNIRQGRKLQETLAKELHANARVPLQKCGIEEVKQFQSVLPDYQIIVLSKEHFNAIVYAGPERAKQLHIYHHDDHYDVITSMPASLNKNYYCIQCKRGYDHKEKHQCNDPCVYCHHIHLEDVEDWKHCADCNRYFKNSLCFGNHKKPSVSGKTTCNSYYRCKACDQVINSEMHKKAHVCGESYCKTCKDYFTEDHKCYMQTAVAEESSCKQRGQSNQTQKYIFFDFECTQDDMIECTKGYKPGADRRCINCKKSRCGSFKHQPNLCVAHKTCEICMKNDVTSASICENCGQNE